MLKYNKKYFYKNYSNQYDKRNSRRKLEYYLKKIYKYRTAGSLLDIGCAYGNFLGYARSIYRVTGCDASEYALKIAKQRLPEINLFQTVLPDLKRNEHWDIITCFDVLEHVQELNNSLKKIKYLLKNNGILVITVPVYDKIIGKIVKRFDHDETHIWKESREFWINKLQLSGYKILCAIGMWRYFLMNKYYLFLGSQYIFQYSPAIMIIGESHD